MVIVNRSRTNDRIDIIVTIIRLQRTNKNSFLLLKEFLQLEWINEYWSLLTQTCVNIQGNIYIGVQRLKWDLLNNAKQQTFLIL